MNPNNQISGQEKMALALRDFRRLTSFVVPEAGQTYLIVWQSPEEEGKILNQTGETDLRGRRVRIENAQPFVVGQKKDEKSFVINGLVSTGDPTGRAERIAGIRLCVTNLISSGDRKNDFED